MSTQPNLSRRRLLLAAGGLALVPAALLAQEVLKGPPVADIPARQISPHVWIVLAPDGFPTPENQGMMCNITFVIGRTGVMVIDSGASLQIGEMAIRQLERITPLPVTGIINTHYHGDHWLGNHAFVERYGPGLPIYAHPDTLAAIRGSQGSLWQRLMEQATLQATSGTQIFAPNHPVGHGFSWSLGDVTLRAHHYGHAHTRADLCVEILEDQVTCVGDVAMDRRIANMDDGSFTGSLQYFDDLERHTRTTLWLPGHGEASASLLAEYRELFRGIYEPCEQAVRDGLPLDAAKARVLGDPRVATRAPHIRGFDSNIGKYVSIAYLEAEARAF